MFSPSGSLSSKTRPITPSLSPNGSSPLLNACLHCPSQAVSFLRSTTPTAREVIQGPHRIVYRLIREEIHIVTVHHAARLLHFEP